MNLSDRIDRASIVICCGAGGVGKTTVAATLGIRGAMTGRKTLVMTIDPAKRLADSLGISAFRHEPQPVSARRLEGLGLRLSQIIEESPAARAGLRSGDVLVEFGGKKVGNLYDFTFILRASEPGDRVEVRILRGRQSMVLEVVLAAWPED